MRRPTRKSSVPRPELTDLETEHLIVLVRKYRDEIWQAQMRLEERIRAYPQTGTVLTQQAILACNNERALLSQITKKLHLARSP